MALSQRKLLITHYLLPITFLLFFLPLVLKLISIHPNEGVFFNRLIGGLKGAKEKKIPDWGQSLGNPYRQGIKWINEHAEPKAKLAFGYELMANIPWIWVRNDIEFSNRVKSGPAHQGEYIISLVNESSFLDWYHLRYLERYLEPIYQIEVDSIPLLKVWKNDTEHTRKGFMEETEVQGVDLKIEGSILTITLPELAWVTRVEFLLNDDKDCGRLGIAMGKFELISSEGKEGRLFLPAVQYDFSGRIETPDVYVFDSQFDYPRPFFMLAAERARVIRVHLNQEGECLQRSQSVRVYRLSEPPPF